MKPIEKKIAINASVSEVWKAITDPSIIEQWMLMPNNFKPELDKDFIFNAEMNGNHFDIKCKVLELEKNKKLVYSWGAPFFEGITTVSIQLKEKENENQTEVILVHSGFAENQKDVQENHSMGWNERFVAKLKEVAEQV